MDPDVESLVRAERLPEAARLCSERGDHRGASLLYERACDWSRAAREALRAGERVRAMELAAQSGDETLGEGLVALLEAHRNEALTAAARLSARGLDHWAARLLEAAGQAREAGRAWERAGLPGRAAELLERSGEPAAAAKVLEAAVRREPDAFASVVALGALLVRLGKHDAAVRTLQRVPLAAAERRGALAHLVYALARLGLSHAPAAADAEHEGQGGLAAVGETLVSSPITSRPRLFGRYEVVREAASSPGARVLECVDVARGEAVAVKLFAAWDERGTGRDALARFEREVRAMRALDHPSIVPLREFVPEGPAIVLGWMAGGTLEHLLSTTGRLAPARALEIATCVLTALTEAHRVGIVHRDVKPSNVLFDEAGGARLSDFGVAHLADASATATAGVFGTLAYMSPEQRGGLPATARSDLFSVGVMLREMLSGERPPPGNATGVAPTAAHAGLDARHDAILAQLTAEDPQDRPLDAGEARRALLALPWPAAVDPSAGQPRPPPGSSPWPRTGRLAVDPAGGPPLDTWMRRPVECVALSDARLARARAFARAGHPALQSILRVDPDEAVLWLEASRDAPLRGPLTGEQRATLAAALDALHAAGGVHGQVDAAHVTITEDGAVLRWNPDAEPAATPDRDRLALARL